MEAIEISLEAKLLDDANVKCAKVNELLGASKKEYDDAFNDATETVKALNAVLMKKAYGEISARPNPLKALVDTFYCEGYKVSEEKNPETKNVSGVVLKPTERILSIDGYRKASRDIKAGEFLAKSAKLLSLLRVREYNLQNADNISDLSAENMYFILAVKAAKNGEAPASNRKIVDLLQEMVDIVVPSADPSVPHAFLATKHDVRFINKLLEDVNKKERCGTKFIKQNKFDELMLRVMAHVCSGVAYTVDYSADIAKDVADFNKSGETVTATPEAPATTTAPDPAAKPKTARKKGKKGKKAE